jgi:hypothetical protein
MVGAEGG